MSKQEHDGIIQRLNKHGFAIVQVESTGKVYPFTFDKIRDYAGETPGELGLREGARVRFAEDDERVESVELIKP